MYLLILHLALIASMTAALLTPLWGSSASRQPNLPLLALLSGLLPLLLDLMIFWAIPAPDDAVWTGPQGLLAAMGLYALQGMAFAYWRPQNRRGRVWKLRLWSAASFTSQLAFTLIAARLLGLVFALRYAGYHIASPLSLTQLQTLLTLGIASAGITLAAAFSAMHAGLSSEVVIVHEDIDTSGFAERDLEWIDSIRRKAEGLTLALLLRAGAIGLSIAMGALSSPINPGHYFQISLAPSSSLILVRLMLGVAFPLIYCWLAFKALQSEVPREAGGQFALAVMMILLAEIFGAALTVGNWGVTF